MAGGKQSAKKLELEHRREVAVEMRLGGASHRAIPAMMRERAKEDSLLVLTPKYGPMQAWEDIFHVLRRWVKKTDEMTPELREMELERLDTLLSGIWPQAISGDLKAAETTLKIMERRARLLGLDLAKDGVNVGLLLPPPEIRFIVEGQVKELPAPATSIEPLTVKVLDGHIGISGSK